MHCLSKYIFYEITQILSLKDTVKLSGVCKRNHRIIRTKYGGKNIFMVKKDIDRTNLYDFYISQTMLMTASSHCRIDLMKMLIEAGADVNKKTVEKESSLVFAIQSDRERSYICVKTLIDCGADIESKDRIGFTPLLHAIENGRSDIVELLINEGANVNADYTRYRGTQIHSPLTDACSKSNKKMVKMLLEAGADPHKLSKEYFLYTTAENSHPKDKKIGKMLISYMAK